MGINAKRQGAQLKNLSPALFGRLDGAPRRHRYEAGAGGACQFVQQTLDLVFEGLVDSLLLEVFLACKLAQTCIATKTAA